MSVYKDEVDEVVEVVEMVEMVEMVNLVVTLFVGCWLLRCFDGDSGKKEKKIKDVYVKVEQMECVFFFPLFLSRSASSSNTLL